jgi:hypothetical protein
MAHWIIEDKGFDGQVYTYSNCKECWSDLFHRPYMWNACKKCGELIEDGKEEYVDDIKITMRKLADSVSPVIQERYEVEQAHKESNNNEQNITKLFDLMTDKNNPIWLWLPDNAAMLQFAKYLNDNNVKVLERD